MVPPTTDTTVGGSFTPRGGVRHTVVMSIEVWWQKISHGSRDWLVANNGDAVRDDIVAEIRRAGGDVAGAYLPDEAVDWVEAIANGEQPDPPAERHHR